MICQLPVWNQHVALICSPNMPTTNADVEFGIFTVLGLHRPELALDLDCVQFANRYLCLKLNILYTPSLQPLISALPGRPCLQFMAFLVLREVATLTSSVLIIFRLSDMFEYYYRQEVFSL